MARQNTSAASANSNAQNQDSSFKVSNGQSNPAHQATVLNQPQNLQLPHVSPPVNVPAPAATFASQAPNHAAQSFPSNPNLFTGPPPLVPPTALDPAVQHQLIVIKMLKEQGIPDDKIPVVLAAMSSQGLGALGAGGFPPPVPVPQFPVQNQNQSAQNSQNGWGTRQQDESRDRDRNGLESVRSPDRYRRRSRSRSPPRGWNARDSSPSRRRDGPSYDYERDSPGRNRGGDDRGRGGRPRGNEYRQRSPPRRGRSPTPPRSHSGGDKWVGHDNSIGKNNIKGMERNHPYTLYLSNRLQCSAVPYSLEVSRKFLAPYSFEPR
jgi:protein NRD1